MKYATETKRNRAIASALSQNRARAGQSMTALLVGLAIMGCVGAGAATISRSSNMQEETLSIKNSAAELMDTIAGEVRTQTRFSDLAAKYDGKTFSFGDGEFKARMAVTKVCNVSPSANCDRADVFVEIADKRTGEVMLKQTVTRTYTHHEEPHAFSSLGSLAVPDDAIAIRYTSDSGRGNSGDSITTHGYDLKINSATCAAHYKPNSVSPRPNGCVACTAPSGWKQYWSGDCTVGTCGTGKKATPNRSGCQAITCPSGYYLSGDYCARDVESYTSCSAEFDGDANMWSIVHCSCKKTCKSLNGGAESCSSSCGNCGWNWEYWGNINPCTGRDQYADNPAYDSGG